MGSIYGHVFSSFKRCIGNVLEFILSWLSSLHMPWRFLPFLFIHVIPQLFGNRHGFGNFLEHNAVGGRCIFCLYKMFTTATKTHLDHPFRRHGM